jgi:hypothetical protein
MLAVWWPPFIPPTLAVVDHRAASCQLPAANAGTVMHLAGRLCSVHAGPFLINSAVSRIQLLACVVTQWLPRPSPRKTLAVPRPAILIDDSITLTVEWQRRLLDGAGGEHVRMRSRIRAAAVLDDLDG